MVVKRFDVYLINLDPTIGSEIKKVRPCLVVSPDHDYQRRALPNQSVVQVSR